MEFYAKLLLKSYKIMLLLKNKKKHSVLFSVAEMRLSKDLAELSTKRYTAGYTNINISFPYNEGIYKCVPVSLQIKPDQNHLYAGAWFHCIIKINPGYPFKPPIVVVKNQVYHPNIDIDTGYFAIDALQEEEWKPVMTVNSIIFAIELVLYEPNLNLIPENILNLEIAELYKNNKSEFQWRVSQTLQGGIFFGKYAFAPMYGESTFQKRPREGLDELTRKMKKISISAEMSMEVDPL
ncbi:unnamed protein product [Blepharisma stoltei]|uniref:UBC core domain-containing protein n=1 Tax=Blepharisma stoltei TaxID=1481888 RepID=A0AAU9K3E9_9CILI|nr:unnamed protein product [Blepharisma stoltei]